MFIVILVISALIILGAMFFTHHLVKSIMLSSFQGIVALFAVNLIGDFINVHIALNWFSFVISTVGGLPGVIFLLINDVMSAL